MSRLASQLFERLGEFGPEISAEASRLVTQGASELANALFAGSNGFVIYGPGQATPTPEYTPEHEQPVQEQAMDRGMER